MRDEKDGSKKRPHNSCEVYRYAAQSAKYRYLYTQIYLTLLYNKSDEFETAL